MGVAVRDVPHPTLAFGHFQNFYVTMAGGDAPLNSGQLDIPLFDWS
jgi:hypothetical protein